MKFKIIRDFVFQIVWIVIGAFAAKDAADGAWAGLIFWFMLSVLLFFWQFIAVMKGQE